MIFSQKFLQMYSSASGGFLRMMSSWCLHDGFLHMNLQKHLLYQKRSVNFAQSAYISSLSSTAFDYEINLLVYRIILNCFMRYINMLIIERKWRVLLRCCQLSSSIQYLTLLIRKEISFTFRQKLTLVNFFEAFWFNTVKANKHHVWNVILYRRMRKAEWDWRKMCAILHMILFSSVWLNDHITGRLGWGGTHWLYLISL